MGREERGEREKECTPGPFSTPQILLSASPSSPLGALSLGPGRSPAPPPLPLPRCPLPFPSAPQTLLPGPALLPPPSLRPACLLPSSSSSSPPLPGRHHFVPTRRKTRAPRGRSPQPSAGAATARRARAPSVPGSPERHAAGMGPGRRVPAPWPRHLLRCVLLLGGLHLGCSRAAAALPGKALPTWPTSGAGRGGSAGERASPNFSLLFFPEACVRVCV